MITHVIFLLLTSLAETQGSDSRYEISERMRYFLKKLCPQSTICNGNLSSSLSTGDNSDSKYRSCCTDCSCATDCGDTGNCCFPKVNETDVISITKEDLRRQCLYQITGLPEETDFQYFRSYYMTTSLFDDDGLNQFEDCGSKKVGPWGSLHPLFSKQTNTIYKNKFCAEIVNVTDGVYWDAVLRCKEYNPENLLAHLANGSMPQDCRVQFIYPGSFNDLKPHICYRDMFDYCTRTNFRIPKGVDASKDEITEACESGLVSPYYGDDNSFYANVFCHICSGSTFKVECSNLQTEKGIIEGNGGYIGLMDMTVISKVRNVPTKSVLNNQNRFTACPKNTKEETVHCRPLLCPSGQMRNSKGECVFLEQQWYQQTIQMTIELISEVEFEMTKAFDWPKGHWGSDIKSLAMPSLFMLNGWTVHLAYYNTSNSNNKITTTSLLVIMSCFIQSANPMQINQNISLLLRKDWFLKYDNGTLSLKPSLFKMRHPYPIPPYSSHFEENESLTIQRPVFEGFYASRLDNLPENPILITKLHLCEQIELARSEYYLSADNKVLYNKIVQQYSFDSEFVEVLNSIDGKVRICLQGSGFVKNNVANCGQTVSVTTAVAVFVVFSAIAVILVGVPAE